MMYLYVAIFAFVVSVLGALFSKVFALDGQQSFNAIGLSLILGILGLSVINSREYNIEESEEIRKYKIEEGHKIERLKEYNEELSIQVGDQQMELSVLRDLENMSPYMKTCCMHVMSYGCMSSNILEIGEESVDDSE